MDKKLFEILTKINMNYENKLEFMNSNINKIIKNKEGDKILIVINSKTNISDDATNNFISLFKSKYSAIKEMKIDYIIEKKYEELNINDKVININNNIYNENNKILYGNINSNQIKKISFISKEENNICIEARLFGIDEFSSSKSNFNIITLKLYDLTSSIYAKIFFNDKNEYNKMLSKFKIGQWYKIFGNSRMDRYSGGMVLNVNGIDEIESKTKFIEDLEEVKRIELNTHTKMSVMDGVVSAKDLINHAKKLGHSAIAITDTNNVQAFPEAFYNSKDIKVIYGVDLNCIEDNITLTSENDTRVIKDTTFVVFDFETTGFNAGGVDQIIEVGAVKIKDGEILDKFSELIDPKRVLDKKITEITNITDEMLKGKREEEDVIKDFIKWFSDCPLVAHNAKFDMSFLNACYRKYNLGTCENNVIDTLDLSRILDKSYTRHNLSAMTKRYNVEFDEEGHHRADYDAHATALVLNKMFEKLDKENIENINSINNILDKEAIIAHTRGNNITILTKNNKGLRNLFELVSLANTKYLYKTPRIPKREIKRLRENLFIGSGCFNSEIIEVAKTKSDEELAHYLKFYDYIEIEPICNYKYLIDTGNFTSLTELENTLRKIINVSKSTGILVVAVGNVHMLNKEDLLFREVLVNQKGLGGTLHPLKRSSITKIPEYRFLTTREMLDEFYYINDELAYELVVTNPKIIENEIENVQIIKDKLYTPTMKDSDVIVKNMVYEKAKSIYGDELPTLIEERIEKELSGIIGGGFDVIYLIAEKLVKKSNEDGYIVGSRGSVGSSFVATMMGITEVNPLPAHYVCPNCKKSIFELDGKPLGNDYSSGYDLPDKVCDCGTNLKKEGQDMPFATFLGFNADKVPDIDLNFSGDYQGTAHDYTKVLFGSDKVFRAGTISTIADKTAFGYARGYANDKEIEMNKAETERLAMGITGVKRTTGQHPGGIIVIPNDMDIFDFTPYGYPADDNTSSWFTTHFDFHAIHDNVLKLDILGHDDPTSLKMLSDETGIKLNDIKFDDNKILSLFSSPEVLGVKSEDIMCHTGTLGIPEFGTKFVLDMLKDTKPKTFAELVKISGLSHGTDVWIGNAKELIQNGTCEFKEVIGCRDDIMVYLMYHRIEPLKAFKIMEFVRKGFPSKKKDEWKEYKKLLEDNKIEPWYINSCEKIKYMFPKAHATAYVMMGYRVAYFKLYYPIEYYKTYFSIRSNDFDIVSMNQGSLAIKNKIEEIINKGYEATNKEINILGSLQIALEMTNRGFKIGNVDLLKSDSFNFVISEDRKTLIPPFKTIEGLGEVVAKNIINERNSRPFLSIEDFAIRTKASQTIVATMKILNIFGDMEEENQMSLF